MGEPLKNSFGPDVPERIAGMVKEVHHDFDVDGFVKASLHGFADLELTPRARQISDTLADFLPKDREAAIQILIDSLGPEAPGELTGMDSFIYLPHVFFVADHGLDCFETSMRAQYELTKRFTAEFSIRSYLERYPTETLMGLRGWAEDPNLHVRRLVSEGTRPRLPWASRLKSFQLDPSPVVELLELLKDDPEEYVRRSVANNLNDISKDHGALVVKIARRWWKGAGKNRKRLVRHGLRTLIKQGDAGALAVLGYGPNSPAVISRVVCIPRRVKIGEKVRIEIDVQNPSAKVAGVLVDLRVHFVKKKGSTSPRVFKGAEMVLDPGEQATVGKTISVAQHSTRTHYPGTHRVEVMLNGTTLPGASFELVADAKVGG